MPHSIYLSGLEIVLVLNMKLVKKVLSNLNGLHYRQEYLCLAGPSQADRLFAYKVDVNGMLEDISHSHCFVGYSPVIFAFSASPETNHTEEILILFSSEEVSASHPVDTIPVIARLKMKKVEEQKLPGETIVYYKGIYGMHRFLSFFHQLMIRWYNRLYQKQPGNVYLAGNLYNQVMISYSIPRKVCLITVRDGEYYNLFPTDLHGQVSSRHYLISLRHEGMACRQVEAARKIVLSEMQATAYRMVYQLGKNHMQPLKQKGDFPFSSTESAHSHLPLPEQAAGYKELQLESSLTMGIHKILLFRINYEVPAGTEAPVLMHIHNSYATWRYKKGLESNYLLR